MSWKSVPLTEAFWFQEGPGVRKWQFKSEGVKLLNVGNITPNGTIDLDATDRHLSVEEANGKYAHFLVDAGDLVIASSGISFDRDGFLRTKIAFIKDEHLPLCMNTSTIRFKVRESRADLKFLRHWLQSFEFRAQVSKFVTGSAQLNFGPSHLKKMTIKLPPLPEQKRIAAILDQADALRKHRQRALDHLNQLGQSIFYEMFGEKLNSDWRKNTIQQIASRVTKGESPKWQGYEYTDSGSLFVTSENVGWGKMTEKPPKYIPVDFHHKLKRSQLNSGDLLINLVGASIGRACRYDGRSTLANINQAVCVVSTELGPIFEQYLLDFILSEVGQQTLLGNRVDGARANISLKNIRDFNFYMPSEAELIAYNEKRLALNKAKNLTDESAEKIELLFKSLQQRAFRGEL